MNESKVVRFFKLQRVYPKNFRLFLVADNEGVDTLVDRKWCAQPPLFLVNWNLDKFFQKLVSPVKHCIFSLLQQDFLFVYRSYLPYRKCFGGVVAYMICISDFNNLFELFDIVLAEGLQSTVAGIWVYAIISCQFERLSCKLSIKLARVWFTHFYGKLKSYIWKQIDTYVFTILFESIRVKLFDGILLIEDKGKTSVVDNIADTIDIILLSCFIFYDFEEGIAIWLSLDRQLFINAHKLSRNHYVLAYMQWNYSVIVDKVVFPDD